MERPEFVPFFREVIDHPDCTNIDAILYGYIYWLTKLKNEKCTASNETLASLAKTTPQTVKNSLNTLERAGLITRRFMNDDPKMGRSEVIPLLAFARVSPVGDRGGNPQVTGGSPTGYQNKSIERENPARSADAPRARVIEEVYEDPTPLKEESAHRSKSTDGYETSYTDLCLWATARRRFPFANMKKQFMALKKARTLGIGPEKLKSRWKELEGEDWRDGFDWTSVVNSFDKRA